MSTRARVGLQLDTGTIRSIYVYFDGYPEGLGATLIESYTTKESVAELISYGDASAISATLEKCVFYSRDKNEHPNTTKVKENATVDLFALQTERDCGEYYYLFVNDEWMVGSPSIIGENYKLTPVKTILKRA